MMPSRMHIDGADYVFNRAYDVANQKVVKMLNIQNKQLVQKFANKREWLSVVENVEVEESSSTFEDNKSSTSMRNLGVVATKHHLMRTSSMDSSASHGKKLKEEENNINGQVQDTTNLKLIDADVLSD